MPSPPARSSTVPGLLGLPFLAKPGELLRRQVVIVLPAVGHPRRSSEEEWRRHWAERGCWFWTCSFLLGHGNACQLALREKLFRDYSGWSQQHSHPSMVDICFSSNQQSLIFACILGSQASGRLRTSIQHAHLLPHLEPLNILQSRTCVQKKGL
jgi:hypothetical protein